MISCINLKTGAIGVSFIVRGVFRWASGQRSMLDVCVETVTSCEQALKYKIRPPSSCSKHEHMVSRFEVVGVDEAPIYQTIVNKTR